MRLAWLTCLVLFASPVQLPDGGGYYHISLSDVELAQAIAEQTIAGQTIAGQSKD